RPGNDTKSHHKYKHTKRTLQGKSSLPNILYPQPYLKAFRTEQVILSFWGLGSRGTGRLLNTRQSNANYPRHPKRDH
ncbi:MAG: hypothetical protein ACRC2N_09430, partial [Aeromonas sp.]